MKVLKRAVLIAVDGQAHRNPAAGMPLAARSTNFLAVPLP